MSKGVVITVDGPAGSGKGTLAKKIAEYLGFYYLDSGLLYRGLALWAIDNQLSLQDPTQIKSALKPCILTVSKGTTQKRINIFYKNQEVSLLGKSEEVAQVASQLAALSSIRAYLFSYQREARGMPGLVADGRDMGSNIFPEADIKFYLEASLDIRAKRRWNQLKELKTHVSLSSVQEAMFLRDQRDTQREIAPAQYISDMVRIDSSELSISEVFERMKGELAYQLKLNLT